MAEEGKSEIREQVLKGKLVSRVTGEAKGSRGPRSSPHSPSCARCPAVISGLTSPPRFLSPQLKISFSETALETTYQYPSESSVLEELGPEPEAPSAPSPPAAQPDDEEDEEELLLLQRELQGGLRTKALIVGEQQALPSRGRPLVFREGTAAQEDGEDLMLALPGAQQGL